MKPTFPIDISVLVSNHSPVWPGHSSVNLSLTHSHENGDIAEITHISMGAHTITHLDAPRHFVPKGSLVNTIDLRILMGPVHVLHVTQLGVLTKEFFEEQAIPSPCKRLLLRIDAHSGRLFEPDFYEDYVGIDAGAAQFLIDNGLILIGTDYLSIGPFHHGNVETHQTLLGEGVVIVEGLNLVHVPRGDYSLMCLPIALPCDGAPCRAILLDAHALPELHDADDARPSSCF